MRKLLLVCVTLISLCSYAQRDPNKVPFYFFIENLSKDYSAFTYYVAEVLFTTDLGNNKIVETLDYKKDLCYYDSNQEAIIFNLDKNKDYKICIKKGDKLVNIYLGVEQQEPKHYFSLDVDFSANKMIQVYFDKDKQYYLSETKILPQ